jgi:starch synthase (maltosyl-transferring)
VNLDTANVQSGWTNLIVEQLGLKPEDRFEVYDILSGETYFWNGPYNYVMLDPAKMPAHILHLRVQETKNEASA